MNCKCNAERAVARNLRKDEFHPTEALRLENLARFSSGNFKASRSLNTGSGIHTAANKRLSFYSVGHRVCKANRESCTLLYSGKLINTAE